MTLSVRSSIHEFSRADWSSWFPDSYPFMRWEFLAVLEDTDCVGARSGWINHYFVLSDDSQRPIAVAPCWLKDHSYGEYVFDWSWASAWERSGLSYYPKLVTAAPFTPASGPRVWCSPKHPHALSELVEQIGRYCRAQGISSWHCLFAEPDQVNALEALGLHTRLTTQFHWFNRSYRDFDDFVGTFASRKRKSVRRERRRVEQQGLTLRALSGDDIDGETWAFFHRCYQMTYAKRSGHGGYLGPTFFTEGCPQLGDMPVMVVADHEGTPVAAALYFRGGDTLYGRYWGCLQEFEYLHFEACYYQGIDYCIREGLSHFDPGAQGEHKIQRGFEPVLTHSAHWIADSRFDQAVAAFTREESAQVRAYRTAAADFLPFRADESPD
jgi:predicted N-acyltransferase